MRKTASEWRRFLFFSSNLKNFREEKIIFVFYIRTQILCQQTPNRLRY